MQTICVHHGMQSDLMNTLIFPLFAISACPNGMYGYNCTQKCACETGTSQICHHVTGTCTCRPGYYGLLCEKSELINFTFFFFFF